tara:strand:+ start:674 stop:1336 length:663 start_codon:yes stop_codon:yes gene_type:complete
MTYEQAQTHIDNLLDKTGTAYFTATEKNLFIDLAVMEYTKGLINTLESDSESMNKLTPLMTNLKASSATSPMGSGIAESGGTRWALPSNLYHLVRAYTEIGDYNVNIISQNEYGAAKNDPFHKPDSSNPVGYFRGATGARYLIVQGNSGDIAIEYIRMPIITNGTGTNYVYDGETIDYLLGGYAKNSSEEIVNIAVRKMMLSLEDPRYQLQNNELTADKR